MGGNALKKVLTRRYLDEEYFKLEGEVFKMLGRIATGLRVETIPAYAEKESFGDMDVMIEYRDGVDYMDIVNAFSPGEVYRNGKVISFDYKELQIDLIITRVEFFDFSLNYYSYNDLGNLMGRIAHKMGMKYGHEGLDYTVRSENHIIGSISLTMDSRRAFEVLDYDYDVFLSGFKNLLEIFKYVRSSRFFSPDIFKLENRNHRSRVRDAKRPTYNSFLKYCEYSVPAGGYVFNPDKSAYIPFIATNFPLFTGELDSILVKDELRSVFKGRFNGQVVMKVTGLSGKALGQFMAQYKNEQFVDWVLSESTTEDDVLLRIGNDFMAYSAKPLAIGT